METLQQAIHKLEVGGGMRYFRVGLLLLGLVLFVVGYNLRAFRNMSTQEAMDNAQLARNIATGKGYTTYFIRPFSMFLVKRHNIATQGPPELGKTPDLAEIKGGHPDLANPPVYPAMLAGLMKVLPFHFSASATKPFWSSGGRFWRYQPDFLISLFNQVLLLACVVLVYFLARRLFGPSVAWFSALLALGTELYWRFAVSGLSTNLLLLIFLALAWCLVFLDEEAREPKRGFGWLLALAILAGLLTGAGGLTRYAFGWLIVPVVAYVALFAGQRRVVLAVVTFIAFAGVMTPWVVRNFSVSGTPFGTASYSLMESPGGAVENQLERSLEPEVPSLSVRSFTSKLLGNTRQILLNDLPKLSGNWAGAFFLVGLLVAYRTPSASRLRYFLVACVVLLSVVQALGRTQLSEDSPDINSENLLVLLGPLVLIYGVSLFFLLFEQIELPFRELRYAVLGLMGIVMCLPMLLVFLPPRGMPLSFPPYYPPQLEAAAAWAPEGGLTVSDMPWAMAWYGERQCVWLSNAQDLMTVNDYQKGVHVLLLTRMTLDDRFMSQWLQAGEQTWGKFVLGTLGFSRAAMEAWVKADAFQFNLPVPSPSGATVMFPLHYWQNGWPQFLLLTDSAKPVTQKGS
jgi:hypothetical protein